METEELRLAIFSIINRFSVDKVVEVEKDMSVEDRISLFYLLNDDPVNTLNILTTEKGKNIVTEWCRDISVRNGGEWKLRLIESLALMQNFRTLQKLGYQKRNLAEVKQVLDCANRSRDFDYRKALYSAFDNLTVEELSRFIGLVDGQSVFREPADLYKPHHIELYLLEWQIANKIGLEIVSLNRVVTMLDRLGFTEASSSLKHSLDGLQSLEDESEGFDEIPEPIDELSRVKPPEHIYTIYNENNIGICVVINQNKYHSTSGHSPRRGSDEDKQRLFNTMSLLNIKCIFLDDLKGDDIFPAIEKAVRGNFKRNVHSILFVVVMSHGNKSVIFGVDGVSVNSDCIRSSLSNATLPCLSGIPKIIIFQACRGESHYHPSSLEADGPSSPLIKTSMEHYIICYSTIPGFKTYRHVSEGSMYIKTLCDTLTASYKEHHVVDIITKVNHRYHSAESLNCDGHKVSMIAEFVCSLEGPVYLCKQGSSSSPV